jgi:hypothetical protein
MRFGFFAPGEKKRSKPAADRGQDDVVHRAAEPAFDRLDVR